MWLKAFCCGVVQELVHCGRRDALQWAQQTGLLSLASTSSMSSVDESRYSPMSSTDGGVWLPSGSSAAAAMRGSNGGSGGSRAAAVVVRGRNDGSSMSSADDAPVGTSLMGLVKALVTQSANSKK
jgi:hypothetical protein